MKKVLQIRSVRGWNRLNIEEVKLFCQAFLPSAVQRFPLLERTRFMLGFAEEHGMSVRFQEVRHLREYKEFMRQCEIRESEVA